VLALRARALADLGERRQPLAALSDAYEALTEPQEERHPTDFFDLARLDAMARACLLQLGRYTDATDALSRALCARPATDRKGRSLALLELAAAHVRQDEPDEACRSAAAALTGADADVLVAPVVAELVKQAAKIAGVPADLSTHTGRRTVVTSLYVDGGEALDDIARYVGHAKASTTAGYVKRLGRRPASMAKRAAEVLDRRADEVRNQSAGLGSNRGSNGAAPTDEWPDGDEP